jgi:hypothetical protein
VYNSAWDADFLGREVDSFAASLHGTNVSRISENDKEGCNRATTDRNADAFADLFTRHSLRTLSASEISMHGCLI